MPHGKRIAEMLVNIGAVKLSIDPPFTWTSGIKSPIYCDNRMLYSHPDARDFVVKAFLERVRALHVPPDVIAGTATAAIGWGAIVASFLRLPFVYVRNKAKEHGTQKMIEGPALEPGEKVVMVEDVITTGGSVLKAIRAVETLGAKVIRVICLVDRNEGAAEMLADYNYSPIFNLQDLSL